MISPPALAAIDAASYGYAVFSRADSRYELQNGSTPGRIAGPCRMLPSDWPQCQSGWSKVSKQDKELGNDSPARAVIGHARVQSLAGGVGSKELSDSGTWHTVRGGAAPHVSRFP